MNYNILGIHIKPLEKNHFLVYVAWQSSLPGYSFAWRCTSDTGTGFPDTITIQGVAEVGKDVADKKLVKKLFPYLPGKSISH